MAPSVRSRVASLVAVLGSTALGLLHPTSTTIAAVFGKAEVDPSKFAVVASPYGTGTYQLLILEQVSDKRPCWSESGANPVVIDPLLLQFDFTGICARSTDSNGYSMRMADRDFGLLFQLSVIKRENDLVLLAIDLTNRDAPPIEVGKTNGLPQAGAFAKITLNPGWRLTKRTQEGKPLGMVYLTSETAPPSIKLTTFVDTQANWAKTYIDALAAQKIISGFEDGTFRPDEPVTRVQFAAIVSKAFATTPQRPRTTFKDIQSSFWGAEAIQSAYEKGFMSGYPEGTFKPNQQIPRVEALVSLASGLKFSGTGTESLAYYQDAAQIPDWATGSIAAATAHRLVVNYPRVTGLNPTRPATRAEVAAFVYQALVDAGQVPPIASPYIAVVGAPSPGSVAPAPAPGQPSPTPPPTPSPTPSSIPAPSPSPGASPSPSLFPSPAPSPSPSASPSPAPSPRPGTAPSVVPSPAPSISPSPVPSPSPSPVPSPSPGPIPSPSPGSSPSPVPLSGSGSVVVPTIPGNP